MTIRFSSDTLIGLNKRARGKPRSRDYYRRVALDNLVSIVSDPDTPLPTRVAACKVLVDAVPEVLEKPIGVPGWSPDVVAQPDAQEPVNWDD